jgi:Inositol monophosphatase family
MSLAYVIVDVFADTPLQGNWRRGCTGCALIGTAALDLAWVAEGRLDCSVTLGNLPWDTAAGVLIAREAGARVVDADGSPHDLDSAFTLAAVPDLIDQLVLLVSAADGVRGMISGSQVRGRWPAGGLDVILGLTSVLIFEFDGAVCDFTAALPGGAADAVLAAVPPAVTASPVVAAAARIGDPYVVLAAVAEADAGATAAVAEVAGWDRGRSGRYGSAVGIRARGDSRLPRLGADSRRGGPAVGRSGAGVAGQVRAR